MGFATKDVIGGRFEIIEVIGTGSQGSVFRAKDLAEGGEVALKWLDPPRKGLDASVRARMEREARAMGTLAGTSAVKFVAFGEAPNGGLFLAMELLRGQSLDSYLRDLEAKGEQLAPARLFELLDPIVDTLEAAHKEGIVHRDLKPANIFILDEETGGGVRLLDFGLAKDLKADALTKEGAITGSPSYIAPEGWSGMPQELDHRIDVYTLGVMIFRALGGRVPFPSKKMYDLILSVTRGPRPSLHALRPDLPKEIDAWVERALASSRDERFQDVRGLWYALGELFGRSR